MSCVRKCIDTHNGYPSKTFLFSQLLEQRFLHHGITYEYTTLRYKTRLALRLGCPKSYKDDGVLASGYPTPINQKDSGYLQRAHSCSENSVFLLKHIHETNQLKVDLKRKFFSSAFSKLSMAGYNSPSQFIMIWLSSRLHEVVKKPTKDNCYAMQTHIKPLCKAIPSRGKNIDVALRPVFIKN